MVSALPASRLTCITTQILNKAGLINNKCIIPSASKRERTSTKHGAGKRNKILTGTRIKLAVPIHKRRQAILK